MAFRNGLSAAMNARQIAILTAVLVLALLAAISLRALPAVSSAGWDVLAASGDVEWRDPDVSIGGWQALEIGDSVPDGAEVRTGGNGTAIVAKGLDRIELRPNTELVVAARASSFGRMEIDQTSGSATYTVEKRPSGTFSVHTPYVVAVVKGTKFSVDIENKETSVSVSEGRVGVSDRRSGESADVTPGQTARSSTQTAGLDVGATPATSKASNAAPKTGVNPNPSAQANVNASTRGNSADTPGQGKSADAGAGSGGSGGDSDGDGGDRDGGSGGGDTGGDRGGDTGGDRGGDTGGDRGGDTGGDRGGDRGKPD